MSVLLSSSASIHSLTCLFRLADDVLKERLPLPENVRLFSTDPSGLKSGTVSLRSGGGVAGGGGKEIEGDLSGHEVDRLYSQGRGPVLNRTFGAIWFPDDMFSVCVYDAKDGWGGAMATMLSLFPGVTNCKSLDC